MYTSHASTPLCYYLHLYATNQSSVLLTKPLCYYLNLYATNQSSVRLTKPLCYYLNLYATNQSSVLLTKPLCYYLNLYATTTTGGQRGERKARAHVDVTHYQRLLRQYLYLCTRKARSKLRTHSRTGAVLMLTRMHTLRGKPIFVLLYY
jgi:hypothetical protein